MTQPLKKLVPKIRLKVKSNKVHFIRSTCWCLVTYLIFSHRWIARGQNRFLRINWPIVPSKYRIQNKNCSKVNETAGFYFQKNEKECSFNGTCQLMMNWIESDWSNEILCFLGFHSRWSTEEFENYVCSSDCHRKFIGLFSKARSSSFARNVMNYSSSRSGSTWETRCVR